MVTETNKHNFSTPEQTERIVTEFSVPGLVPEQESKVQEDGAAEPAEGERRGQRGEQQQQRRGAPGGPGHPWQHRSQHQVRAGRRQTVAWSPAGWSRAQS